MSTNSRSVAGLGEMQNVAVVISQHNQEVNQAQI